MLSQEENYYIPGGDDLDGGPGGAWKPPPPHHMQQQQQQQHRNDGMGGPPHASKLNTWANRRNKPHGGPGGMFPPGSVVPHPPPNFNNGQPDPKLGWSDGNRHTPSDHNNKVPWSDPLQDPSMMFDSLSDDVFGMQLGAGPPGQQKMGPPPPPVPNNGTPHQWGRSEINQSTPWEIDNARAAAGGAGNFNPDGRFMQPVSMDNGTGQWRAWEQHDGSGGFQKEFHHGNPAVFLPGGVPGGSKMHGNFYGGGNNFMVQQGFNDRMMRNGPPHMNQQQPQQWKAYGAPPQGAPMMPPSMVGQRAFMPAPPPLAAAHPPHPGMQGPPPPLHSMPPGHMSGGGPGHGPGGHQQPNAGNQFNMGGGGGFNAGPGVGMGNVGGGGGGFQPMGGGGPAPALVNDDSVWHDPNGDLRKWQRDTGTGLWGDPTKQVGQPIKRWQNVDENDPMSAGSSLPAPTSQTTPGGSHLANIGNLPVGCQRQSPDSSSIKKPLEEQEEVAETGWGELPPLNGGPIPHAPPPGPAPQLGIGAGGQPPPQAPNMPWMGGAPPMNAQTPTAGAGWSDPQQQQQQQQHRSVNNQMPPVTTGPNAFYNNQGAGGAPSADWGRMAFGGGGGGGGAGNGAGAPFNGGPQPLQFVDVAGGSVPNGGGGGGSGTPVSNSGTPVGQGPGGQNMGGGGGGGGGSTNEIADKLRLAASKGWLDPALFSFNNKLSAHTAELLTRMITLLTLSEQNSAKIDQLQRALASGNAGPNGAQQQAELERLRRELHQMTTELNDLREKIHGSMDNQRATKGMSLVDELSNMNSMPIGGADVPLW